MEIKLLPIMHTQNETGTLLVVEGSQHIPFAIERVYYILDVPSQTKRGGHAHIKFNQVALCIRGNCKFLLDNGKKKLEVTLDNPSQGLLLEPMVWHEMYDFSNDCILSILADAHFDEQDYIRDYKHFLQRTVK